MYSSDLNKTRDHYYAILERTSRADGYPMEDFVHYAIEGLVDGLREQLQKVRDMQMTIMWQSYVHERFHGRHTPAAFTCLANIALLQACISSGMLPTNRDYEELFQALDLNLIITNDDLNIRFATAGARRNVFNKEMLFAAQNGAVEIDKNTQLRGYNLRAGYTFGKN